MTDRGLSGKDDLDADEDEGECDDNLLRFSALEKLHFFDGVLGIAGVLVDSGAEFAAVVYPEVKC